MKTEMLLQSSFRLILMLLLVVNSVDAQNDNDLEGWSAVELNLKATKKLSFSVAEHLRFRNDISTVKNYFTQIKVNYEILKNLELGAGVRYITKNDDVGGQQGYDPFFRYQFDAAYRHKIEKVDLFFRLRYQNKNQLGRSESEGDVAKEFIRTRFGVGYKIKPLKLTLRVFAEHFNQPTNSKIEQSETRMRYTLKLNRRFKKIGAFTVFYGIQNNSVGDVKTKKSFLGLKYAYKIDFTK
ncbi:MAG: DUF2490 domain-containing protein [Flavobacteriaceae bacterium]